MMNLFLTLTSMMGLIIGYLLAVIVYKIREDVVDGVMLIDETDPNKTQWILNVQVDLDSLQKRKYMKLAIHHSTKNTRTQ